MSPHCAEASLVRVEFDSYQLITALVIEADTDIRMGIVAGNRDEFPFRTRHRIVPSLQVLVGPREEICEHQICVTAIGPYSVKEQPESVRVFCIRKKILDLDATR